MAVPTFAVFRSLALTAFAACCGHASAATAPELFPVARDGAWGYIDRQGTLAISPRFESADAFHDGIASVRDHGVARHIDSSGRFLSLPRFDRVGDFSEGLAPANRGEKRESNLGLLIAAGRWGYVDARGKLAIPLRYTAADPFSEGLAAVRWKDGSGFIDHHGSLVIRADFDTTAHFVEGFARLSLHGHIRYIDRTGHTLPTPALDDNQGGDFSQGRAAVSIGGQWGYIDASGRLAIPARYVDAKDFSDGYAAVRLPIDRAGETPCQEDQSRWTSGRKYGYIDLAGTLVVPPLFDEAGAFGEGLAPVRICHAVSYIDARGKTMLDTAFEEAMPFHAGLAQVWSSDADGLTKGYIDATGKLVWAPSR